MAKIKMVSLKGETVKDINLNDEIWNTEVNEVVMSDAIRLQLASLRQGTHKTKDRSEVRRCASIWIIGCSGVSRPGLESENWRDRLY